MPFAFCNIYIRNIYIYIIDFKEKTTKRYFHGLIIMKKIIRRWKRITNYEYINLHPKSKYCEIEIDGSNEESNSILFHVKFHYILYLRIHLELDPPRIADQHGVTSNPSNKQITKLAHALLAFLSYRMHTWKNKSISEGGYRKFTLFLLPSHVSSNLGDKTCSRSITPPLSSFPKPEMGRAPRENPSIYDPLPQTLFE